MELHQLMEYGDLATTTFGPLEKYVADNDNVDPVISELRNNFRYDRETGLFTWLTGRAIGRSVTSKYPNGYIRIRLGSRSFLAHRVAWAFETGSWPENDIDHMNLDRADNRWSNLRAATRSDNLGNISARRDNVSGLKGAYFSRRLGRWQSFIQRHGEHKYLGLFNTAEEAHAAYVAAANDNFGEFARAS